VGQTDESSAYSAAAAALDDTEIDEGWEDVSDRPTLSVGSKAPPDTGAIDSEWGDDAPATVASAAPTNLRKPEIPRSPSVPREFRAEEVPATQDGSGVRRVEDAGQRESLKQRLSQSPAPSRAGSGTYAAVRADALPAPAKRPSRKASGTRPSVRPAAASAEEPRRPSVRKATATTQSARPSAASADAAPQPKLSTRSSAAERPNVSTRRSSGSLAAVPAPAASVTEAPKALTRPPSGSQASVRPPPPSAVAARLDAKLPARPENDVPFVSSELLEDDEPTNPAVKLAQLLSRPPSASPPAEPAKASQPSTADARPIAAAAEATPIPTPSAPKDLPKAILPELPPAFPSGDVPPTLRDGARLPAELGAVEQSDDPELSFTEVPAELLASDAPTAVSQPPRVAGPGRASWLRKPAFAWGIAATAALALGTAAGAMLRSKPQVAAVAEVAVNAAPVTAPESKQPAESPQRERFPGQLPAGQAPRPGTDPVEPAAPAAAPAEMKSVEVHVTPARAQIVAGAERLGEGMVTVQVAAGEKKVLAGILAGSRTRKIVIDGSKPVVKLELTAETPVEVPTPKAPPATPAVAKTQPDNPPVSPAAVAPTKSFASDTPTPAAKTQTPRGNRPWEPENFASDEAAH
jgi:hypothetical protein